MNPAQLRLTADRDRLRALAAAHPEAIRVLRAAGEPPTAYEIELRCRGAEAPGAQTPGTQAPGSQAPGLPEPLLRTSHVVRVRLPAGYPIKRPTAEVVTPAWNPHVFSNGMVCLGSEWSPGQGLDLFVRRLWRILVWDPAVIDPGSAADGAAMDWYEANPERVPFDRTDPDETGAAPAPDRPRIAWNG